MVCMGNKKNYHLLSFFLFLIKTICCDPSSDSSRRKDQMRIHNIWFQWEIRKIIVNTPSYLELCKLIYYMHNEEI